MSVIIDPINEGLRTPFTFKYEVKWRDHNCSMYFRRLSDAKSWATSTFNLSGKWRKRKDGSYEEVTDA